MSHDGPLRLATEKIISGIILQSNLLDTAIMSNSCFIFWTWSFLYNVNNILEINELFKFCAGLQFKLTVNSKSVIDGFAMN